MFSSDVGRARGALFLMTAVWGSTFVVNQTALKYVSPNVLVTLRFGLAALTVFLLRPAVLRGGRSTFLKTLPLGLATTIGFILQIGGLGQTTPSRSAFLTSLFVMVVPMLEALRDRRLPSARMLLAVAIALAGVAALFSPGSSAWTRGDTMTMLSTVAFAFYVIETDRLGKALEPYAMTFHQFVAAALFTAPFIAMETPVFAPSLPLGLALGYLVLICSTLAIVVAAKYQHFVSPTEAAVIYTCEPIVATALSIGLGREPFTWHFVVGGGLIAVATMIASLRNATVMT